MNILHNFSRQNDFKFDSKLARKKVFLSSPVPKASSYLPCPSHLNIVPVFTFISPSEVRAYRNFKDA